MHQLYNCINISEKLFFRLWLRVFCVENDNILSPQGLWFRFAAPFGRTLPAAVGYVYRNWEN